MTTSVGIVCPDCGFDGRISLDDDCFDDDWNIIVWIYCPECGHEFKPETRGPEE